MGASQSSQVTFWSSSGAQLSVQGNNDNDNLRLNVNGTAGYIDVSCPGGMTTNMNNRGQVPHMQH